MVDEILEEVWRRRDEFAKRHNYDLDSMVAELREMERKSPAPVVSRETQEPDRQRKQEVPAPRR